jgi:ABC-type lipoprotein release transport system permease subunit
MRPTELTTAMLMTSVLVVAAMPATIVPARRASRLGALTALRRD